MTPGRWSGPRARKNLRMGHREGHRYIVTDAERAAFERDGYVHLRECADRGRTRRDRRRLRRVHARRDRRHGPRPLRHGHRRIRHRPDEVRRLQRDAAAQVPPHVAGQHLRTRQPHDRRATLRRGDGARLRSTPGQAARARGRGASRWHQDQAYWINTDDRRTATCWLAVDDSTLENGCMRFVPGSHREPVRPHRPAGASREEQHTLVTDLRDDDHIVCVPIARGDITVHNEGILHGSGGNTSPSSRRRAYVNAYRSIDTSAASGTRVHALAQRRPGRARPGRRPARRPTGDVTDRALARSVTRPSDR